MAVTTDPFVAADLAGFIPEKWPGMITEELFAKAEAARFFVDLSSAVAAGGDIIHIPDVYTNTFTVQTHGTQGAEVTTAGPAQVDTTLTVDTHDYVAFIIGDKDMAQLGSQYNYNTVYTQKSAGVLRTALEDALFGLWSSITTTVGDTATVLADAEIRTGIETMEALNFDTLDGETAFFFHPYTFWIQLGAVTKYYDQSARGPLSAAGFVSTGEMGPAMPTTGLKGTIYGIPAYVSSRVVSGLQTYRNILANKALMCYATGNLKPAGSSAEGGRVRAQSNYELRNLGYLTVVDMLFGVHILRAEAGVVLNGSSVFIGS
jgi:hypothetical protein